MPAAPPADLPAESSDKSADILEVRELRKHFGAVQAVRNVSLKVNRGEIVGLLGPNGAGKTTTFYMIAGLIPPSAGRILLNSRDITKSPIHLRSATGLGYLSQEPSVFRNLTVAENLSVALEQRGLERSRRSEALQTMLEAHQLSEIGHQLGSSLSGGERRRTEVARVMAAQPDILLMDEPFAGVDPISVEALQIMMQNLTATGLSILITDHNARDMMAICHRIYVVLDGDILAEGEPGDIIKNSLVRERYLGSSFRL